MRVAMRVAPRAMAMYLNVARTKVLKRSSGILFLQTRAYAVTSHDVGGHSNL